MKGLFITFEGGEGAGKTTLAKNVFEALVAEGHDVLFTREPGGTHLGEEIRNLILHSSELMPISPRAELFLFLASRIQHLEEVILPALKKGKIVICDRFSDSTIAYQGAARKVGVEYVTSCCELACQSIDPDLTILVDIDPEIGLERTQKRSKHLKKENDRIEKETYEFHKLVRDAFCSIAKKNPQRVRLLNGALPQREVFLQAMNAVTPLLQKRVSHGLL